MSTKVFLTGATGFIGGDALYALHEAHPEFEYALLVRSEQRGKLVAERYPKARLVYGSLSDAENIEKEAAAADIVIHTAESADSVESATAIAKGMAAGHSAEKPGFWIHVSGTGILEWYDETHHRYGQPPLPDQTYRDVTDIERVVTLPDQAGHRDVDKVVQAAARDSAGRIKTAIIAPPTIYATGRGPVNRVSAQVPDLARFVLTHGYAPIIETGETEWDHVHVEDLGGLFVLLVDAALDPVKGADSQLFGPKAYFFAENGVHRWSEVGRWIADEAHKQGYIEEPKVQETTWEAVNALKGNITWACNSRSVAERARKYLGWKPTHPSLKDTIPDAIKVEAEALGIKPRRQ